MGAAKCGKMDPCHAWNPEYCDGLNGQKVKGVCWPGVSAEVDSVLTTVGPGGRQASSMARISREDLYIQGYVDDLALMITGKFLSTVSELIQKFLNIV
jgi:hypothetical protein